MPTKNIKDMATKDNKPNYCSDAWEDWHEITYEKDSRGIKIKRFTIISWSRK